MGLRRIASSAAFTIVLALVAIGCATTDESAVPDSLPLASTVPLRGPECDARHGWSVARLWNEELLDAIRRDFPAPTTHARNLYHLSASMWDVWAAYDPEARGVFVDERLRSDRPGDVEIAISHAAHRLLTHRFTHAAFGAEETIESLDRTLAELCLSVEDPSSDPHAAFGRRVADAIIDATFDDGSNEADGYRGAYEAVNPPLVITEPGTPLVDPDRWQPLEFDQAYSQHGQPLPSPVQVFVGPQWGHVDGFALEPADDGLPIDPGPQPLYSDPDTRQAYKDSAIEVLRYSARLDPSDGETIDISPGSRGASALGTDDGQGHSRNPSSGVPYAPNVVPTADYGRVIAEFWADGPDSETPPGHWNTLANTVSDHGDVEHRIGGTGPVVDRLEWDVSLYLALNGALHDAAIAAWGTKAYFDSVRPISMIRWLSGNGQASDPSLPNYNPDGIDLVDGLVEVITAESASPGGRHAHLVDHIGEVAVRSWRGWVDDPNHDVSLVGWIRGVEWLPYQRSSFVTPAFAGYVSGHSAFSRAGAEVLGALTGDDYFPGGLGEWTIEADSLEFEAGPEQTVTLQWATYADAADQAGNSRLWGGIHIVADDHVGRRLGFEVGRGAWDHATTFFTG